MGTIFGGGAGLYAASMGEPLDIVAALVPSAIFATGLLAQMGAGIERDVKGYVMQSGK